MQSDTVEVPLHERLVEVLASNPAENGFEVQYQPIVRLGGHATVAVEAFVRWQHPVAGKVEPAQFMLAAERTGLTSVLDDFVLKSGVRGCGCVDGGVWARCSGACECVAE